MKKCVYLILLMSLCSSLIQNLIAQDYIYFKNNTISTVTNLQKGENGFSYQHFGQNNDPLKWIEKEDISLIVKADGEVLAYYKQDSCILPFDHPTYDLILLKDSTLLPMELTTIADGSISGSIIEKTKLKPTNFSISKVAALFDRTKKVQAFSKYEDIAQLLIATQNKKTANKSISYSNGETREGTLKIDMEAFKKRALEQTHRLTHYISLISNRETSSTEADKAIAEALTLFINNECIVEVSNANKPESDPRRKTVIKYLNDVKRYFYDKVIIEWIDIYYVGEIRKGTDGNYYGTVSFAQKFQGIKDDIVVYQDITYKTVEVVFQTYDKFTYGLQEELWDVRLANIKVEQTTNF